MSRKQSQRSAHTRQRLLGAAAATFAQAGYEHATAESVARAAGVSKGAFFFHFAAKEDALLLLAEAWIADRTGRLRAAAYSRQPAAAALVDALDALLTYDRVQPRWQRLLPEFWSQARREPALRRLLTNAYADWREILVALFSGARAKGIIPAEISPSAAADLTLAVHDGLALQSSLPGARRVPPSTRLLIATLLTFVSKSTRRRRAA
jgi:AcrR family transcriptional regulator